MTEAQYKPYKKGYFLVSGDHKLYFELFGNPKGIPAVYFHGGPGSGFDDKDKRFFDPKVYNVLFFDQRGAGRSRPFANLKENTTDKLIEDTKKLMNHVGFKKALLVGGSWGATLALAFSINNPDYVLGIIVRGTFLAHKKDFHHYSQGGVKKHAPDIWERFVSIVPKKERKNIAGYYLSQMLTGSQQTKEKYTFEWAYYECSILKLKTTEKEVLETLKEFSYKSLAPLEAYYIANNCFLTENFILKNASGLSKFPVSIIHGRYDYICPSENSYELHKKIKGSKLIFTIAGHASKEKENEKAIRKELARMALTLG